MGKIKAKSCLFININKTNKPSAEVNKKKKKKRKLVITRNETGYITKDPTTSKEKEYYHQLYTNKFNSKEMN